MSAPLLILGASARAAAWSALRAGLTPFAADLFGDRDLAAVAGLVRVRPGDYPGGLVNAAETFPPAPWLYTGALENRPELVDRLAARRTLWGNAGATLRAARDPFAVAEAVRSSGLLAPEVRRDPAGLPRDGSWLRKPLASAGGRGVGLLGLDPGPARRVYYQKRVEGLSLSAVFVGAGGEAWVAGVTAQLVGRPGAAFAYRGNVAPWPVAERTAREVEALGHALAGRLGLVGLFGVDLILDDAGRPWPVEINPRYTASVEVIELATGRPLLEDHRRACEGRAVDLADLWRSPPGRFVAKEVVYAGSDGVYEGGLPEDPDPSRPFRVPAAADLPRRGTRFAAGDPVFTVFSEGTTPDDALGRLRDARGRWAGVCRPG